MKHFNEAYNLSKIQFVNDMKTFNQDDLNKEDEVIERSIKDSNYYPDSTPQVLPADKEKALYSYSNKMQFDGKSPDIEVCQEASNFKDTADFIEIGKSNELKIH